MSERNRTEQFKRGVRAMFEVGRFLFIVDGGTTYCQSDNSKETHTMTEHTCSCGDFTWRMGPRGGRCKHLVARRLATARVEVIRAAR
jgi:predicted nucleic acid-binding Zn finger protein